MAVLADEEDEEDFEPYEASVMAFGDREGVTLYDFPDWESDPLGVLYGFYLTPADVTQESWFRVSDLFDQGERKDLRRPLKGEWNDDELTWWESLGSFIDLYPGQFLEMHNCMLFVYYGNG